MHRLWVVLLSLGVEIDTYDTKRADASKLYGLPRTGSDHPRPVDSPPLGSDAIHSPPRTVVPTLTARQQEIMTGEPSAGECTAPSTVHIGQASCVPAIAADTTGWLCGTSTSTTVGCGIGGDTTTTSTITSTSLTAVCAQSGCATCISREETPAAPATVNCRNCTTVSGQIFAQPATVLPPNYHSGQLPAQPTAAGKGQAQQVQPRFDVQTKRTHFLDKRTFVTSSDFAGDHNSFMLVQVHQAANRRMLVPHRPSGTGGRSSAKVNAFRDRGFSMAVDGLHGCTSILVVSRRGAWISHIWESPTMLDEALFSHDVLYGIFQGDNSGWFPGIAEQSHGMSLFNTLRFGGKTENFVQPIIVTPYIGTSLWGDPDRPWRFMPQIQKIGDLLYAAFHVQPIVEAYRLIRARDVTLDSIFSETAHGKVVIQYDPQQYMPAETVTDSQGRQHTCFKQYSAVRVYADVRQDPIYEDIWLAMPEQAARWGADGNWQQVLRRHEIETRDESDQIVIYGCVKLVSNETESTCGVCTSKESCSLDPGEDQGQDGVPMSSACPFCTSGTCGLDPNDDQGQDGAPPPINGTTTSGWNVTTTSNSSCSMVTLSAGIANGTSIAAGPACGCGSHTGPVRTATGTRGQLTLFCSDGTRTVAISTANLTSSTLTPTPTSSACSISTVAAGVVNDRWHSASEICKCGTKTTDVVARTGTNGSRTLMCGNDTSAVALTTDGHHTAAGGIGECSITTDSAKTFGAVTVSAFETCACAGGQGAPVTTWKDNRSWYAGCVYASVTATVSTLSGPVITECSLTSEAAVTHLPYTGPGRGWMCHCNDGLTATAVNSTRVSAIAYACPTKSPYPQPVTTVDAPMTSAPPRNCTAAFVPAITIARSGLGTTKYFDHWTCGCNGSSYHGFATSLAPGYTAVGCQTEPLVTTYMTTVAQTPKSCTVSPLTNGNYYCTCDGGLVGAPVTTSGQYYCSMDDYIPTTGSATTRPGAFIAGPTVSLTSPPKPTGPVTCRIHVILAVDPRVRARWPVYIWSELYGPDGKNLTSDHFDDLRFDDLVAFNTRRDGGVPNEGWLMHNVTMQMNLSTVPDKREAPGAILPLPGGATAYRKYHKKFTYGDWTWYSTSTKEDNLAGHTYCSTGGWAIYELGLLGLLPPSGGPNTQDLDCWFDCEIYP